MVQLYREIRLHPIIATSIGVVGGCVSLWGFALLVWSSFDVQDPFIPTVWAKVKTMRLGHDLLFLFPVVGLALSLAVVIAVVVSAVQHKREAERLRAENVDLGAENVKAKEQIATQEGYEKTLLERIEEQDQNHNRLTGKLQETRNALAVVRRERALSNLGVVPSAVEIQRRLG
jgi:hypothetical protein